MSQLEHVLPVATYKKGSLQGELEVGKRVLVSVLRHHDPSGRLNNKEVITSRVTRVGDSGVFETEYSTYTPEDTDGTP